MTQATIPGWIDWGSPVEVTLEFKTDVFTLHTGEETRRAEREFPRLTVSFGVIGARGNSGSASIMALARRGQSQIPVPVPSQQRSFVVGSGGILIGESDEAWLSAGRTVFVLARTPDSGAEERTISDNSGGSVTLAPAAGWPAGTPVLLIRAETATTPESESIRFLSSSVSQRTVSGVVDKDLLPVYGAVSSPPERTFRGRPVLAWRPNWSRGVDVEVLRRRLVRDLGHGKTRLEAVEMSARFAASHVHLLRTEAEAQEALSFFAWCRGRQASFYAPTWAEDLALATPLVSGSNAVRVRGREVQEFLAHSEFVDSVCLWQGDTLIPAGVLSWENYGAEDTQLLLDRNIPAAVSNAEGIGWLLRARFASDSMTIAYLTPRVAEVKVGVLSVLSKFEELRIEQSRIMFGGDYVTLAGPAADHLSTPEFLPITIGGQELLLDEDYTL